MGLLDDILGQVLGKGSADNAVPKGNVTKPIVLALLALLASGALSRKSASGPSAGSSGDNPLGGLLGGLLGGGGGSRGGGAGGNPLGGMLGGGALGGLLGSGLGSLLNQFQQTGHGDTIDSWIGTGQNRAISPQQLGSALSPDVIRQLSEQSGLDRDDLLSRLSQALPGVVDQLTPQGQLPAEVDLSDNELSRLSEQLR
jgi:uncharacterized protein YidB (DUF937 family)